MNLKDMTSKKWDLIVVGGGLTGVAAAVSARRQGLDVLILEKAGFLGGAPGTLLINPFMPYSTTVNGERFELSRGFFSELRALLREVGGYVDGREDIHEEYLKLALDRLVTREGVNVLFHTTLCGAKKDGEAITEISVVTKAGVLSFTAQCYIDCTGDADLAVMAGRAVPADDAVLPHRQRGHTHLPEKPPGHAGEIQAAAGRGQDQKPARERADL